MDFLGFDIYLIILVASFMFVLIVIWLMNSSLRSKKSNTANKNNIVKRSNIISRNEEGQALVKRKPKPAKDLQLVPQKDILKEPEEKESETAEKQENKQSNKDVLVMKELTTESQPKEEKVDVIDINEEEIKENDSVDSIDDIFQSVEDEDNQVSDLAKNLEDVDLETIRRLSEEISQVLIKKTKTEHRMGG